MQAEKNLQIAVVGSGPSGCFLTQALNRKRPEDVITVFDQLAAPYGLIRYGVATDHQQTKAITRQFDRLFAKDNVQFAGNIEIGSDVSLEELRNNFDVVVLATGRPNARQLDIPGKDLDGVFTSGDIIYSLNSYRGTTDVFSKLGEHIVLVGGGNVAIDLLRFLIKEHADYDGSDVNDDALQTYLQAPVKTVTVLNRSSIDQAKSDVAMLKELGSIDGVAFSSNHEPAADVEAKSPAARRRAVIEELTAIEAANPRVKVEFKFGYSPVQFIGADSLEGVEVLDTQTQQHAQIVADSVVTAIGFDADDASPIYKGHEHLMRASQDSGRIEPGLYRTGWLKRGAIGTIPANRACALEVAGEILDDITNDRLPDSQPKAGFAGIQKLLDKSPISFDQWTVANEHEIQAADANRIRKKFVGQQAILDQLQLVNS